MGLLTEKESQSIPSAFGVPSYFVDTFFVEPAGHGCVRLYACSKINGELVTQYVAVIPAVCLFESTSMVREMALAMLNDGAGNARH